MIQVCEPSIGQEEIDNVTECLQSGRVSGFSGKWLKEFEQGVADSCGAKHGVSVSNCGAATLVTLEALGIGKGDEVIINTFTMAAPHFAIVRSGALPVLVDSEHMTWNIDAGKIEEKIRKGRTKAILVAHVYGHPAEMTPILNLADMYKLHVIEDAAEAHGAMYKNRKVGCLGTVGNLSFYFNKTITTGEGGMIVTNDTNLAERAKLIKSYATVESERFVHKLLGFNFRMSNVQAAIGCAQIKKLAQFVDKKRHIAERYTKNLDNIPGLRLPLEMNWARSSFWVYGMLVRPPYPLTRDKLMQVLAEKGVETRQFFVGMHQQPIFRRLGLFHGEQFPVSDELTNTGLYLPNGVTLTDNQIDMISEVIRENSVY